MAAACKRWPWVWSTSGPSNYPNPPQKAPCCSQLYLLHQHWMPSKHIPHLCACTIQETDSTNPQPRYLYSAIMSILSPFTPNSSSLLFTLPFLKCTMLHFSTFTMIAHWTLSPYLQLLPQHLLLFCKQHYDLHAIYMLCGQSPIAGPIIMHTWLHSVCKSPLCSLFVACNLGAEQWIKVEWFYCVKNVITIAKTSMPHEITIPEVVWELIIQVTL